MKKLIDKILSKWYVPKEFADTQEHILMCSIKYGAMLLETIDELKEKKTSKKKETGKQTKKGNKKCCSTKSK